jgi:thymidylate synthase (FAD)
MTDIRRWGDDQQFLAAPMRADRTEKGLIIPKVSLLWMTPDPLGANAAMGRMYKGIPTYSMADITDEERRQFWADSQATHLKAPLESIKLHFFIEGVTRSFTHQMVRQRTAVYAQESMRFAVKENMADEVSMPPSIASLAEDHPARVIWNSAIEDVSAAYNALVDAGIPSEDARGLAPHAVTTRLNYVTDLRNLSDHAGNRLCTQAQFEWRIVFLGIVDAIRNYTPDFSWITNDNARTIALQEWEWRMAWQFRMIADSSIFRPVCYQLGHCPFKASFDRACSIRERVDVRAAVGSTDSEKWHKPMLGAPWNPDYRDDGIRNEEWLTDPSAARLVGGSGH